MCSTVLCQSQENGWKIFGTPEIVRCFISLHFQQFLLSNESNLFREGNPKGIGMAPTMNIGTRPLSSWHGSHVNTTTTRKCFQLYCQICRCTVFLSDGVYKCPKCLFCKYSLNFHSKYPTLLITFE